MLISPALPIDSPYAPPRARLADDDPDEQGWRGLGRMAQVAVVLNGLQAGLIYAGIVLLILNNGGIWPAYLAVLSAAAVFTILALWPCRYFPLMRILACLSNFLWLFGVACLSFLMMAPFAGPSDHAMGAGLALCMVPPGAGIAAQLSRLRWRGKE